MSTRQQREQPVETTQVIPVVEEQVRVDKQLVTTGSVRIAKSVREEEETVNIPVVHEEVQVERVAVNLYVETPPPVRYEGETMIIPILREVVVVEKRLMLVEEVHVTKRNVETQASQQVTLRKEEVTVERLANNSTNESSEINSQR